MAFLQGSAIRSPTDDALRRESNRTSTPEWSPASPQWDPEDNTSLSPSEAGSRASSPATEGGLSNEVKAMICNFDNELKEAKVEAESNRRKVADLKYKVQQLEADLERERESAERSIHIERNTVMCFRQEYDEIAEDVFYLNRTLPILHEQREFTTLREQEMHTEQLIIAYLVRGEVRETVFKI